MTKFTADELHKWSQDYEMRCKIHYLMDTGHPLWLKRRAVKLRKLAEQKEKMRGHKAQQRRRLERKSERKLTSEILHDLQEKGEQ